MAPAQQDLLAITHWSWSYVMGKLVTFPCYTKYHEITVGSIWGQGPTLLQHTSPVILVGVVGGTLDCSQTTVEISNGDAGRWMARSDRKEDVLNIKSSEVLPKRARAAGSRSLYGGRHGT